MESDSQSKVLSTQRPFLEDLLKRKFFYIRSFDIYGGVAGLYDYGPPGCAVKTNVEQYWREHFVLEENMLEINATCLTPENVFVASGHVEKFCDYMVKDAKNNQVYRADKYLEEWIDMLLEENQKLIENLQNPNKKQAKKAQDKVFRPELKQPLTEDEINELKTIQANAGGYKKEELHKAYLKLKIKSRDGNDFTEPQDFNLMFQNQIGPTGTLKGYLRPETAQGIFVNFKHLLNYNSGKLPFAGAQLGLGFRNEIAPRAGLLRVREFQMAEIEHFVDPLDKNHPKFKFYKDYKLPLYSQECQSQLKPAIQDITLEQAVQQKIIDNETLAYFMCRTYLFLTNIGILTNGIRFRQHMKDEMAHYAQDCWDAEILTSYGWIECVGIADRSCYDLQQHMKHSKEQLMAARKFDQPIQKQIIQIDLNKQMLGKQFKKDQEKVQAYFEELSYEEKQTFKQQYENAENKQFTITYDGQQFVIDREAVVKITEKTVQVSEEKFTPSVVEPSFGIGRILYAIFEHRFKMRDEQRTYLNLPPRVAPVKTSILTVINLPEFQPYIQDLRKELTKLGISSKIDDGGASIGKRYARTDEIGIPFGLTLDKQTIEDNTLTIRELNTMEQIRVPIKQVPELIQGLVNEQIQWSDAVQKYPKFVVKADE